jgi:hypothetical protein
MLVAAGSAQAQTHSSSPLAANAAASDSTSSANESSSSTGSIADGAGSLLFADRAEGAAPAAGAAAGQGNPNEPRGGILHRMAFEAGGGFNAPSSDSSPYITWGGNFTAGSGFRLTQRISAMVEYQFIDDKLPGAFIAETGANGGDAHIWSLTAAPVFDLFPKRTNDLYVTGGGGFYRKVTNFTDPQETEFCNFYACGVGVVNSVVGHFSSNQGGWNIGGGFQHRLGGAYGDGKMKLFAEARYLDIMTPAITTEPNGLGKTTVAADTKLVPVTFGIRF